MKKTREEIMADIARIVGRQLGVEIGVDEINGNDYLYDDLGLDSLRPSLKRCMTSQSMRMKEISFMT